MATKTKSEFYSEEELQTIRLQWSIDRARIDEDPVFGYYVDKDKEYERHLNNTNLRALFRHAAHLFRGMQTGDVLHLYPDERPMITKVFRKIEKDGYYSRSKTEERKIRVWFGKAVSRQHYRRLGKYRSR